MTQPVGDIVTPYHLPMQLDITIDETGRVHDLVDMVCIVLEYHGSIGAAEFEGLQD